MSYPERIRMKSWRQIRIYGVIRTCLGSTEVAAIAVAVAGLADVAEP